MATSKPSVTYVDYITDEESPPPETPKKKRLTKAEKRERKMKAEIEFRKMEMYDNLRRELALAKQSSLRGQEEWTDMCRQIKLVQMKEELQSWEAKTNRVLTQKDDKIALILEEIRETEEMHKRNFGMQLKIMDYLSAIFKVFQNVAKLHYEDQAEILHDFYNETEEKKQIEDSYQRNCENIMHATNLVTAETLREDFEIYLDKRNDQVNREIEKRYILRDTTAKKMQKLHKQLLQFLDTIRNASLDPHKDEKVRMLVERQRTFVVESKKLNDTEKKFGRQHEDLREEMVREEAEAQRRINDLKLEQKYFLNLRKEIEERMQRNASDMHEKLKIVTSECYGISKDYQKLQKYGDLLLSLAANCRKLQTESEKVVPWGDFHEMESADMPQEDFVLQTIDLQSHVDLNEDELKKQIELMQNFWQRQSIAEAQAIILEKRKQELLHENQIYIEKIKSLSKTDNVEDLRKTLHVQCVLEEEPQCPGFKKP